MFLFLAPSDLKTSPVAALVKGFNLVMAWHYKTVLTHFYSLLFRIMHILLFRKLFL